MPPRLTRRGALAALAGSAGGWLWSAPARAQPAAGESAPLHVSVHAPGGRHLDATALVLVTDAAGATTTLARAPGQLTYATTVRPGRYRLRVSTGSAAFAPVDHAFTVPADGLYLPAYLGKPGWPSFRWGPSVVPFEPVENVVAVAFPLRGPGRDARARLPAIAKRSGLDPHPNREDFLTRGGTVAFFRAPASGPKPFARRAGSPDVLARLTGTLAAEWPGARVGMPIDTRPGRLKILDNRYVVRCRRGTSPQAMVGLARKSRAATRPIEGLDDTWLFEFAERGDYLGHLKAIESFGRDGDAGDVIYAEPSLIFDLQQHACADPQAAPACTALQADLPGDPWAPCESNLTLQNANQAWCFLEQQFGAAARFGRSSVCIATVDAAGINATHPDAGPVEFVDLCSDCAAMPDDDHGMSVYGIVSAQPGNGGGTAGIAPGVHHIAVRPQRQWSEPESYARMIRWLGGLASGGALPTLSRAPDIVACSHGLADLPAPSVVSDAFYAVSDGGRTDPASATALGTVLVYSAGNENTDVCGTQGFAAHPRVIAVGNTMPADAAGLEVRAADSNFGAALALCAQGAGAPSLLANPAMRVRSTCRLPAGTNVEGAAEFGGTSAACPMVAASAALMLSARPDLSWSEVGALLRGAARCVDPVNGAWVDHRSYRYGSGRLDVHGAVRAAAAFQRAPVASTDARGAGGAIS